MNGSALRLAFLLVPLLLGCVALAPTVQATCLEGCSDTNTFLGEDALVNNTTGSLNTAVGFEALLSNTTGFGNTAVGYSALRSSATFFAQSNTAIGFDALFSNIGGGDNTATGVHALLSNTAGGGNTATGLDALYSNTTGGSNTAIGVQALQDNTTGSGNIALGDGAGEILIAGSDNIYVGNNGGSSRESARIRIGTIGLHTGTFIAGISDVPVIGSPVLVNHNGKLGVAASSARFKTAIKPMDKTSEAILALEPVTFRYKKELDPDGIPQFGLVAEQVQKVNPDLVARDDEGKPYTVRYEAVNAMLLNEFLKEHRKVEQMEKQIELLTAGLQKMSAQIELNRSERTVQNNR